MQEMKSLPARYGMLIDLDRCTGCGNCMMACAVENNLAPAHPKADSRTGITWMRVYPVTHGADFPYTDTVYVPMLCQQCEKDTPCIAVCPQNAVDMDPSSGIVGQIPQRCFGCRYCMTACPYHARSFNWWDPQWPEGQEKMLNPDVAPRMRGVVEKCNFCHGRWHAARVKAAAQGRKKLEPGEYVPACVESCPTGAILFGDLADPEARLAQAIRGKDVFRFLEKMGTESKVYYRSRKTWVKQMAETNRILSRKDPERS